MFAEYLDQHPLEDLLAEDPPAPVPPAGDPAWQRISETHRAEIEREAAAWQNKAYPMRSATGFLAFVRDGSRKADEDPYFERRRKLCWHVLAACLDGNACLDGVVDGLWCICEETSWVISAHNVNPVPGAPKAEEAPLPDPDRPYIDLFSAQTGMILAFTAHLLKDRLAGIAPVILRRIEREIHNRILDPFMNHDEFWWMGFIRRDLCNWTPWIVSNIMLCAWLSRMERGGRTRLLDRACRMLDRWLAVVPEDGGCDEGAGYWNMAGGALLDCLDILEKLTDGKMAFWQEKKIRNILSFPARAEIGNGWFVNFADCDARPFLSGERLQLAGERLGDPALTALGNRLRGTLADQVNDVPHLSRLLNLLFHAAAAETTAAEPGDAWLPDLQLRIVRRGRMVLCCKGGHNGESHNHNDIGSFMLYSDGKPEIVDAGNMVYTAKTFSEQRYTLWNVRSAYHNLPMIGDFEQRAGAAYAARSVSCLPDGLMLDLAGAYGAEAGIRSLRRSMRLTEKTLEIHDQIILTRPQRITWVFMLRNLPCVSGQTLAAGGIALDLPRDAAWAVEEMPVEDPRMANSFPGSLWRVLLTLPANENAEVIWHFRKDE